VRVVVALGGNALLRRGQPVSIDVQRANVATACEHLAPIAVHHDLVVSHGNGPQIGLLALEEAAYTATPDAPLDVLGAETQGLIGYLVERELANRLPAGAPLVTVLTMVRVEPDDPAFGDPSKPIGPLYDAHDAEAFATARGWAFKPDGDHQRRVVPSPAPIEILEIRQIQLLLDHGCTVICAGGGGIPTTRAPAQDLVGVEAVIDKDHASALLARDVGADVLIMATDAPGAYVGFGTPQQRLIARANPDVLLAGHRAEFAAGSMLPKVVAACDFARTTGGTSVIGALADIESMLDGTAGTRVAADVTGVDLAPPQI
jgi:carbamate kinase